MQKPTRYTAPNTLTFTDTSNGEGRDVTHGKEYTITGFTVEGHAVFKDDVGDEARLVNVPNLVEAGKLRFNPATPTQH